MTWKVTSACVHSDGTYELNLYHAESNGYQYVKGANRGEIMAQIDDFDARVTVDGAMAWLDSERQMMAALRYTNDPTN